MTGFWWNVVLAALWVLVTGELTPINTALGFALGAGVLMVAGRAIGVPAYLTTLYRLTVLLLTFFRDLITSNLFIAFDVVTPTDRLRPAIIAVPLDAETDIEVTVLSGLINLTPGTVVVDISPDRKTLYLHMMYLDPDGPEASRQWIKQGVEKRLLKVTR